VLTIAGRDRSVDPELIEGQPSEEFNYTAGVDIAATPRITIAGDIIGRVVKNSAGMEFLDSGPVAILDRSFSRSRPGMSQVAGRRGRQGQCRRRVAAYWHGALSIE
jgi:hypothetical protein